MNKKTEWRPFPNNYKVPMVNIVFTKKGILNAIKKNTIQHGYYFQFFNNPHKKRALADYCDVCCIGAILRTCILKRTVLGVEGNRVGFSLGIGGSIYHSEEEFLSNKEYLSALNTYFEKIDRDYRIKKSKIKVMLNEFVRKSFPTRFSMKVSSECKQFIKLGKI